MKHAVAAKRDWEEDEEEKKYAAHIPIPSIIHFVRVEIATSF